MWSQPLADSIEILDLMVIALSIYSSPLRWGVLSEVIVSFEGLISWQQPVSLSISLICKGRIWARGLIRSTTEHLLSSRSSTIYCFILYFIFWEPHTWIPNLHQLQTFLFPPQTPPMCSPHPFKFLTHNHLSFNYYSHTNTLLSPFTVACMHIYYTIYI